MIERYEHSLHFPLIEKWFSSRGIPAPQKELVYDTGFVVDGVAIGFLCKTNSKIAFIDQAVTKPGLKEDVRDSALATLFHKLSEEARQCGFLLVAAYTGSSRMTDRFTNLGFSQGKSYKLVLKGLEG